MVDMYYKAGELLLSGDLDGADYKEIKSESEEKNRLFGGQGFRCKPWHYKYRSLVR